MPLVLSDNLVYSIHITLGNFAFFFGGINLKKH